jgi:alpha-glucosidase (family GH31 glycosyl hydrolase)
MVNGVLVARCYGQSGSGDFYDDDGESYAYEQGAYYRAKLRFKREGNKAVGAATPIHDGYQMPYRIEFVLI